MNCISRVYFSDLMTVMLDCWQDDDGDDGQDGDDDGDGGLLAGES